jgi:hypothetical protein
LRIRRLFAATFAVMALGTVLGAPIASAATKGPGLPPVGNSCAMQEWLGIQNVRACEETY